MKSVRVEIISPRRMSTWIMRRSRSECIFIARLAKLERTLDNRRHWWRSQVTAYISHQNRICSDRRTSVYSDGVINYYAIARAGVFSRSRNGVIPFEQGPTLFAEDKA